MPPLLNSTFIHWLPVYSTGDKHPEERILVISSIQTEFVIACLSRPGLNVTTFTNFFLSLIDNGLMPGCWIKTVTEIKGPQLILVCSHKLAAI